VLSTPDGTAHQFDQALGHDQADAGALLGLASCPRRLNGWNSCASFSGGNPAPVSLMLTRMSCGGLAAQLHDYPCRLPGCT
jgi:hypothetical protein